jgi:hypothetical protein
MKSTKKNIKAVKDYASLRKDEGELVKAEDVRAAVDSVTNENFQDVKVKVIQLIKTCQQLSKDREKHIQKFQACLTPLKLQTAYYNYILAWNGLNRV